MIRSSVSLLRPTFTFFIVMATLVAILILRSDSSAIVKDTFEIDADACDVPLPCTPDEAKAGYYAGIQEDEDDWATTTAIPAPNGTNDDLADCQAPTAPGGATPVFLSCNSDRTDIPTCYGSRVIENPASSGSATFICDGNSGGTLQAELDIVSSFTGRSEQKTNDFRWCVNTTGVLNNPNKSDETHGYTVVNRPVVCDTAPDTGEDHTFILGGYERLGNEGTVFAGFIFAQQSPLVITHPSGDKSVNFVDPADSTIHYRNVGDILVLLNQSGNDVLMQFSVAVDHDSNPATVPIFPAPTTATLGAGNCGSTAVVNPKLSGADADNVGILSPPWLGEFCDDVVDPVQDDTNDLVGTTNNQCKIVGNVPVGSCAGVPDASSQSLPDCQPGGNLVPPTDFVEFALDLTAGGITTDACALQTVIMTSRSSDEFTADLKDVAIGQIPPSCAIEVTKTGDELSKVGDSVDYTITISNPAGTALYKEDITDTLLGDIVINGVDQVNPYITSNNCNDIGKNPLMPGDSCTITATRTVLAGDPDPLPNTVTAVYDSRSDLAGFERTDSDDHEVNLFQPSITFDKTGDTLSKAGDDADYTITLDNTSSADTPDLDCTITDPLLGINENVTLASGGSHVINTSRTVQPGDPDPLTNTASVSCNVTGFSNVLTDSDGHSVDLFQPEVTVTKTGDTLSKVGDEVTYTIEVCNTGSADSPDLVMDSVIDDVLGDLSASYVLDLGPTECESHDFPYTVQMGDPDPLVNTVTVHYHPLDFPNDITDSDDHSLTLFQPSIAFDKSGDTLSKETDPVNYTIELGNTSSVDTPDLDCTITDALLGVNENVTLASGATHVINTSRVVQAGDPDPLVNTANVSCNVTGFSNVLTDSDDHSVDLFQPDVTVTKTGDELSKIGDEVTYTIEVCNTGSADSPDLMVDSVFDDVLGVLTASYVLDLGPGDCESHDFPYTVQAGDPDPLVNTVEVHYHPFGFPNNISDTDDHSLNLFQPAIDVDKTGDTLSKATDDVDYTITLSNNSSADTPALTCTATDSLLGVVFGPTVLPLGDTVLTPSRTVLPGDPDPLVNTVTLNCSVDGFSNVLEESDDHSVNLFQPEVTVTKTGDELSKVGDDVTYTIEVCNTGSADSPDLVMDSVIDDVLGDLSASYVLDLGPGDCESHDFPYTVQAGDSDPLVNTVTVHYHPFGFENDISDTDDHSLNLFQPAIAVDKTGDTLSKATDDVDYTITLSNNSSADTPAMNCTAEDSLLGTLFDGVLPLGDTVINTSRTVLVTDPDPLTNTVTLTCSPEGFPNVLEASDGHSVELFQPGVDVDKTGDTLSKQGDPVDYTITVTNTSSADSPDLVNGTIVDTLLGDLLDPANPYVTSSDCTSTLPTGGSCTINATRTVLGGDPDPLDNTVTVHYNPDGFPNDITDSDDHSVDLFGPSINVDKTGDLLSKATDDVDYTITLSNNSSVDSPALDCVAEDSLLGIIYDGILPLGNTVINDSRTVLVTDPDPLVNTVTLTCSVAGFPNVLTASDDHTVELFQPEVTVTKSGDELSKLGDEVTYTIEVCNTGSADSPDLVMDSVIDDVLGNLSASYVLDLAPGACESHDFPYTVQEGDPDPLVNTVEVHYHPFGFENDISDTDDHSLNLFQPAIDVDKTGDTLSKATDDVDYTITLSNNSSADTPALTCTATDSLLGVVFGPAVLPLGDTVLTPSYTVLMTDPDPLVNTVTLNCSVADFPNVLEVSDDHTVELFQPEVTVTKTGDELSKVGDDVTYTIEVCNTGSADSPDLVMDSVIDNVLGDLSASYVLDLAPGACESHDFPYTVQAGDSDPLVNTVEVHYHPDGFPNDISDDDDHSLNLFQPSITCEKTGDELSKVGDPVDYVIDCENTSSPDTPPLDCTITDVLLGISDDVTLASGASHVINTSRVVQPGDPDPLVNTMGMTCNVRGFSNVLTVGESHSVNLFQPEVTVTKTGDELSKVGDDVTYTIEVCNTGSADSPDLVMDSVIDDVLGVLSASYVLDLAPGACESHDFTYTVQVGDPDPLVNTVEVHYHPDGFPNDIFDDDSHEVNLFQPEVDVEKACDDFAKFPATVEDAANLNASDDIRCTITVTNNSSSDSPDLVNGSAIDTLCGDLLGTMNPECTPVSSTCTDTLATGGSCEIVYDFGGEFVGSIPDPISNMVTVHYNPDGFPNDITDNDTETIDVLHPDYTISKDCLTETVPVGGSAIFEVVFTNTGDTTLTVIADEDMTTVPGGVLAPAGTPFTLLVGTPRTFEISLIATSGPIIENTVNASATLPVSTGLTNVLERSASDFCDVEEGATRTPGFWQTHLDYTCHIFEDHLGGTIDLGWKTLNSCEEVFGMFWANNARESDGDRRNALCQARVIGSFQLLAAILNTGLDNGAVVPIDPVTGLDIITAMQNALAGNNIKEIKRLQGLLDDYNNSGDDIAIIDNDGTPAGRANPKGAKGIADYTIADCS